MIKQLTFDSKFTKAFESIFGKALVCRSMDVATRMGERRQFHCVTLEGEQV